MCDEYYVNLKDIFFSFSSRYPLKDKVSEETV